MKIVIVAPFWRQPQHVGVYRIDRFVRWLSIRGVQIIIVRAGNSDIVQQMSWGMEVTIRDPLGLYQDVEPSGSSLMSVRRPNRVRRLAAYLLFNPDPTIIWSKRVAKHPLVLAHGQGADLVLSSSPPESSHICASILAKELRAKLIIDMRDGWLDEPLKPLLRVSRLQQWREGRLEKAVLRQAEKIFVTSPVWQSQLQARLPFTQGKTIVLTNGYPPADFFKMTNERKRTISEPLKLVHAGRFTGSSLSRRVSYLLEPLMTGMGHMGTHGTIVLLGSLETADLHEIEQWRVQFQAKGWSLETKNSLPRNEMMQLLRQADGLLLLSTSQAAIPSKLFEYLLFNKPIFAATPKSSAVWKLGEPLEQIYLIDYTNPDEQVVKRFIAASQIPEKEYKVPDQFHEAELTKIFMECIII